MFASRAWVRFALLLNLIGTIATTLSFQATSSNITAVATPNGGTIMCIGTTSISSEGSSVGFGMPCPKNPTAKPLAVVTVEQPVILYLGLFVFAIGFLIQLIGVASPKSIDQMRAELKEALQQEKHQRRLAKHSN